MTPEEAAALRKPFPKEAVGKLPKGGVMLDYVGHAATTDRLLAVDPGWTWEPLAVDERGIPALDTRGNLWIKLTVCGVTRIGVGDGKSAKEVIGDAIRNAAMRFGVALDLWAKEDLDAIRADEPSGVNATSGEMPPEPQPTRRMSRVAHKPMPLAGDQPPAPAGGITQPQLKKLHATFNDLDVTDRDHRLSYAAGIVGRDIASSSDLTKDEATHLIDVLTRRAQQEAQT